MKPELAALARHRLAQAHETLAEAEQLLASTVHTFLDRCDELLDQLLRDARI